MNTRALLAIIMLGIIMLAYNQPIINEQSVKLTSFLLRSDSIFLLVVLYGMLLILIKKLKLFKKTNNLLLLLFCIYLLGLVATFITLNKNGGEISVVGWSKIVKIPVCLLFYWILSVLMNNNKKAIVVISKTLYLSSTVVVSLGVLGILFPGVFSFLSTYREGIIGANSIITFSGLTPNPWFIAYSLIIAYSFTWIKIVDQIYEKRIKQSIPLILYSILLIVVMILSGIRSILFLIPFSMFTSTYLYNKYISKKPNKLLLTVPAILLAVFIIFQSSWLLLPLESKNTFLLRFRESSIRTSLYQYYFEKGKSNPFGLGYDFFSFVPFETYNMPLDRVSPHNAILSILIISGYLGIAVFVVFLFKMRRIILYKLTNIHRIGEAKIYMIGALTAYVSSWLIYLITEIYPFSDFTHYILLSIILAA